ncbi:MAG: hypothetical protein ACTSQJ_18355 [Promethearchaeota archaeon]
MIIISESVDVRSFNEKKLLITLLIVGLITIMSVIVIFAFLNDKPTEVDDSQSSNDNNSDDDGGG